MQVHKQVLYITHRLYNYTYSQVIKLQSGALYAIAPALGLQQVANSKTPEKYNFSDD